VQSGAQFPKSEGTSRGLGKGRLGAGWSENKEEKIKRKQRNK
jgi:hypothetical protein